MKWIDLTSAEFAAVERRVPVVLGIAAIEQHGPHLPVSTDAMIGAHFLERISEALEGDVLILPQLQICCSAHHMDFDGTLSVPHEAFLAYAFEVISSVVFHGFYNIVLFNSHGGNLAIGQVLIEKLGTQYPTANFVMLTWWKVAAKELADLRDSEFGGVGHACEFETALMRYIDPTLVREALVRDNAPVSPFNWAASDMLVGGAGTIHRTMAELTSGTGVFGSPSMGSAEKGRLISDMITGKLVSMISDIATLKMR